MAKKAKSKKFILKRSALGGFCNLSLISGPFIIGLCYGTLKRYFGLELERCEKKRVRITIEEVK